MTETKPRQAEGQSAPAPATPVTRGVHHLALTTEDMKMTTDFYVRVLGMPLVHAMKVPPGLGTGPGNRGNPPYENIRHYFFDMGGDSLLAFFEIPKDKKESADRDAIGGMQHVAFATTVTRFEEIQARLKAAGVALDGPINTLPGVMSVYFYDPNGIRLEATCQPEDGEQQEIIANNTQSRSKALEELASLGAGEDWIAEMTAALPGGD